MDSKSECDPNEVATSVCAFIADLLSQMEDISSFTSWIQTSEVVEVLDSSLKKLPLNTSPLSSRSLRLLDSSGTALWNAFNRLLPRIDDKLPAPISLIQVPLLACQILANCILKDEETPSDDPRYFKVLVKCADIFLGLDAGDQASGVLKQAALLVDILEICEIFDSEILISVAKYHILCSLLALKNEDLELADEMLSRVSKSAIELNSTIGEQYVELCQTALRLALQHGRVDSTEMWLQKISDAFGVFHKYSSLYEDCKRIHFGLLHVLAVSDLSKVPAAFTTLAKELCREIEKNHPKHPSVLLFQLEYMSNEEQPDSASFHRALMGHIAIMEPTIRNFKRSLRYILKLRGSSSNQALDALENLLAMISSFSDNTTWLEQIFVVLLRLFTSTTWSSIEYTKFLETVANIFSDALPNSLGNAASDASLIIIWKQVESYALQKNFLHAQAWCSLGRHDLFQHASIVNRSRILRKGMFCAFQVVDFVDVERAWMLLPEHDRDSETAYLMYQVYVKEKKTSSAAHLLKWIDDMGNEGPHYIVAAIAATIRLHERKQALQITQILIDEGLDTYKDGRFSFDLFRIAIQIIIIEFRENQKHVENLISQIYEIFSKVFDILQKQNFELTDLDWFARCSYLIALEMFKEAGHSHTLLLLGISLRFTNLYPETIGSDVKSNLEHHRLSCHYLQTLLHAAKARTETNSSRKESSYTEVIRHFQATQTILDAQNIKHENTWPVDRYRQLLVFKVEATMFLSATMDVEPSIPS